MRNSLIVTFLFAALTLTGCGSGNIKAGGTVKFADGTPLTFGTIVFETDTSQYVGHIKPDGTYTASGLREGDGLPAGTYKVAITGAAESQLDNEGHETQKFLINQKYTSSSTSGLTVTFSAENRKFDITVEKP